MHCWVSLSIAFLRETETDGCFMDAEDVGVCVCMCVCVCVHVVLLLIKSITHHMQLYFHGVHVSVCM